MPITDAGLIKERILRFLENNGPSLPVHIAKSAGMDILFTSAFLSELISNQKIKVSHMKVGTSPLYFIPGDEKGIEKFTGYIKGKEGEALVLLKKEKFLEDGKLEPAIRIALRSIKDFAKPFEREGKLFWRYFLENEKDFKKESEKEIKLEQEEIKGEINEAKKEEKEEIKKEKIPKKKKIAKKPARPKKTKENDDKFFNRVKEHLLKKGWEISDIISFSRKDLILKVDGNGEEMVIVAFNKKKLTDKDFIEAYKKAQKEGLGYSVMSLGEAPKKTKDLIDAAKKLESVEKIE